MNNTSSNGVDSGVVSDNAGSQTNGDTSVPTGSYSQSPSPLNTITQGENQMAEVDTAVLANGHTVLANGQAAIRHDIGLAEANIRDKVGEVGCGLEQSIGGVKYAVATEAGALSKQIGAEACGINQEIGTARREAAAGFGDTRYNIATNAGDIRKEGVENTAAVRREVMFEGQENVMATKDARYDLATRITNSSDRIVDRVEETKDQLDDRFFTVGRDLADLKQGHATLSKDIELNALRVQLDAKENTKYLSDKIQIENEKTRNLINDLKYHDLNRGLIERNAELVECEADRRHWRHHAEQNQFAGQWAQLQSQIQAFQSQLQETRQGMVNFGTMAGVGQSSTSNNVR